MRHSLPLRSARSLVLAGVLGVMALPCVAVDANTASRADLEQLRGLGPVKVERLLNQRERQPFTGWDDLRRRVAGIGVKGAAALSVEGLTVNGQAFRADDASPTARRRAPSP
jgi:competence protein ComEA